MTDADGDGYGDDSPATWVSAGSDCDDADSDTFPGAAEWESWTACMTDADGDGYGDDSPATWVSAGSDCDDGSAAIRPGATEIVGDGIDQDCDTAELCYADTDADDYTDGSTVSSADLDCTDPGEATDTAATGDCADRNSDTFPGAAESDSTTACMTDSDGDGYGDDSPAAGVNAGSDCDDTDVTIYPGASEVEDDGIDQDCDGADLEGTGDGGATDGGTADGGAADSGSGVGGDGGAGEKGGCGCASTSAPSAAWLIGIVGLAGLRRRRERERGVRI